MGEGSSGQLDALVSTNPFGARELHRADKGYAGSKAGVPGTKTQTHAHQQGAFPEKQPYRAGRRAIPPP